MTKRISNRNEENCNSLNYNFGSTPLKLFKFKSKTTLMQQPDERFLNV